MNLPVDDFLAPQLEIVEPHNITEILYALEDFWTFHQMLNKKWFTGVSSGKVQKKICNFLQKKGKRKLILVFRGSRKTTILQHYILWRLLNNPNLTILRAASTYATAAGLVLDVRNRIEAWKEISELKGDLWCNDSFNIARTEYTPDPSVMAGSVDTNLVGRHPKLIILDDPVDSINFRTAAQREKIKMWVRSMEPLCGPEGEIIIVGTRWHREDVYDDLIKRGNYNTLVIPAIDAKGKPTWPKGMGLKYIAEQRTNMTEPFFQSQYMLDVSMKECATFKKPMYIEELPDTRGYVCVVDWGWGSGGKDYTVALIASYTYDRRMIVHDAIMSERHDPLRICNEINELAAKYRAPIYVDPSAITILRQTLQNMGDPAAAWATLSNVGSKESRILSIQQPYNTGKILFNNLNKLKFKHLEEEVYDWDFGREHDDALDALAYAWSFNR